MLITEDKTMAGCSLCRLNAHALITALPQLITAVEIYQADRITTIYPGIIKVANHHIGFPGGIARTQAETYCRIKFPILVSGKMLGAPITITKDQLVFTNEGIVWHDCVMWNHIPVHLVVKMK